MFEEINQSNFWNDFKQMLKEVEVEYRKNYNNLDLIPHPDRVILYNKEVKSVINKAYRISVVDNANPFGSDKYHREFVRPENIFKKLKDIIRTEIIVRYIDGIDIIVQRLNDLAKKYDYGINIIVKDDEVGYYAKHVYISYDSNIVDFKFDPQKIKFTFEIQIRTQLQDAIKSILHSYYKQDRIKAIKAQSDRVWRWQFTKPRFATNYVGHILHFFDGLIIQIKNREAK